MPLIFGILVGFLLACFGAPIAFVVYMLLLYPISRHAARKLEV